MYQERLRLYKQLEQIRSSKVIAYITGDRPGMETQIHPEIVDLFVDHLDSFKCPIPKISLYLYSRGGATLGAWNIVNLIRMFCDDFEVIIPSKAHSAATLISIGADRIIMTKQATLSPIDPSINGPYNPPAQGMAPGAKLPVSVEDVSKYFDLAKQELGNKADLTNIFLHLATQVHPLALGNVTRSRSQIQMLAEKMLKHSITDDEKIKKAISFLCSDSGSHDYTINRREAGDSLNLPIEKPNDKLYDLIKRIHIDIGAELKLREPFNPTLMLSAGSASHAYDEPRSLLESISGGSHRFVSRGEITRQSPPPGSIPPGMVIPFIVQDNRMFEGWVYVKP